MDEQPTTSPAPEPPSPTVPRPRLWRGEQANGAVARKRRGPIVPAVLALIFLCVAVVFLATWVRPAPVFDFVPLGAVGARTRVVPTVLQGERDLRALTMPERSAFGRSIDPAHAGESVAPGADLPAIDARAHADTLVVYLCARAGLDPEHPETVYVLPADADHSAGGKAGWLAGSR